MTRTKEECGFGCCVRRMVRGAFRSGCLLLSLGVVLAAGDAADGATLKGGTKLTVACNATSPAGSGSAEFTMENDVCLLDAGQPCVLQYAFNYSNLTSNATAAHLHDSSGTCAGSATIQVFDVTASTDGFEYGTISLSQTDTLALFAGDLTFDVHTVDNPNGEVAGKPKKEPKVTPTVSQWGLASLLLLFLAAGTIVIARGKPKAEPRP